MADDTIHLWGIKIWDDTGIYYYTEVDISQDIQHNRPTDSILTYYDKYPYHIHDGAAFYFSGSCSGNFSDNQSGECFEDYNFDEREVKGKVVYNTLYQVGFIKWLHNDHMKYLQLSENFVIPVGILGEVKLNTEHSIDDGYSCTVSFDWEQLADDYSLLEKTSDITTCPLCKNPILPTVNFCPRCKVKVVIE